MSEQWIYTIVYLAWLAGAACFVLGLHRMNSPATARNGNRLSAAGMVVAVGATLVYLITREGGLSATALAIIVVGFLIGGGAGLYTARTVKMTAMPQLVSLFNAVGGGAAALVAIDDFIRLSSGAPLDTTIFVVLGALIGSVTFTGSLIAGGKLQGLIPGKPIYVPGGQIVTIAIALVALLGTVALILGAAGVLVLSSEAALALLFIVVLAGLIFGVTMVLPIGGADMPVVISLLNSFTGTAAAMAGFVLGNPVLIIAGALVGASGAILTKLMADAMNRSIMNIMVGGFGGGDEAAGAAAGAGGTVREIGADDVAIQLAYAQLGDHRAGLRPGRGPGAARRPRAGRAARVARASTSSTRSIPVAGRMPGHMNVLLAEANVPYPQLKEMDEINPEFDRADVALVIGANDVTNPAARRPGSPVSGMPILDVDHAKSIVVIKRSMGKGYAGIDNELYSDPKTGMLFADAKDGLAALTAAVKAL